MSDEWRRITINEMRERPKSVPLAELPAWLRRYSDAYRAEVDVDPTTVADYLSRAADEIERLTAKLASPQGVPEGVRWLNDLIRAAEAFRAQMVTEGQVNSREAVDKLRGLEAALNPTNYAAPRPAAGDGWQDIASGDHQQISPQQEK
jgi:hypothetical protein